MWVGRAFLVGILAGTVVAATTSILFVVDVPVRLELLLASYVVHSLDLNAWLLALLIELVVSGLLGIAYGAIFTHVLHRADWVAGLGIAVVQTILFGGLLELAPLVPPHLPEGIVPVPKYFMTSLGFWGTLAFIELQLVFGTMIGWFYGRVVALQPEEREHLA